MRRFIPLVGALILPGAATAQAFPSQFEEVELRRARACVGVLERLDALDVELEPLADRSQRMLAIAEAIALEEPSVVDMLDASDPLEGQVLAWFEADAALASEYLVAQDSAVLRARSAARDTIEATVSAALADLKRRADSVIATTGSLPSEAGSCNGAVLIRGGVLEACGTVTTPLCEAARDTTGQPSAYRFVESAEVLWNMQQLRPWSAPTALTATPDGQIAGARTTSFTRTANTVVNLTFYPRLRQRSQLTPEQVQRMERINGALGLEASHPDIMFVPTLAVQASLPTPLGGEGAYLLHFGEPDSADVVWTGAAGTGAPLEGLVEIGPSHVVRLQAGDPLMLTAIRETDQGDNEAVFVFELSSVNQAAMVQALLGYLVEQFSADLRRLVPPGGA